MIPRTLIATAALTLTATVASATDLLQVWQAARQHDPQGAVSEASRAAGASRREQAAALWRPHLGLSASLGWASAQSQMNGAVASPTLDLLNAQNDASAAELAWLQGRIETLMAQLRLHAMAGQLSASQLQAVNAALTN